MKSLFLFFLLLQFNFLIAQSVDFYGHTIPSSDVCNSLGFKDNVEAKSALDTICSAAGIVNNYILQPCSNIGTCCATVKDGVPYILYDNSFLLKVKSYGFSEKKIPNNSNNKNIDWTSLTILAHELGHHVNQHFSKLRLDDRYKLLNELEADEFAGKTLYRLGATLEQVKEAYFDLPEASSINYPARAERIAAVEKGYRSESSKYSLNSKTKTSSFLIGNWKVVEKGGVVTFFPNGTYESSRMDGLLIRGYWNIYNDSIRIRPTSTDPEASFFIQDLVNDHLDIKIGNKIIHNIKTTETAKENQISFLNQNWQNFISTGTRAWQTRIAGGIFDLKVGLTNNSEIDLEHAQVSVKYIKADGSVYKTEYLEFNKVKSKSTILVKAPDSERGTNVKATITMVKFSN